ncbi:cytochrome b5 domain-containing protein [Neomoorella carbonis]|uniref:cytochrome b5 domain-containing protein n=1 Tax=Neomoorella carbonis TaxID=3062783 RepID=UPI00324CD2DE
MARRLLFLAPLFLLAFLLITGCSPQRSQPPANQENKGLSSEKSQETVTLKEFTLEELAQYDGSNGKPAYVAVNGLVYDVTNVEGWKEGVHKPWSDKRVAGRDLTSELAKAPPSHRQKEFWAKLPVVGRLKGSTGQK